MRGCLSHSQSGPPHRSAILSSQISDIMIPLALTNDLQVRLKTENKIHAIYQSILKLINLIITTLSDKLSFFISSLVCVCVGFLATQFSVSYVLYRFIIAPNTPLITYRVNKKLNDMVSAEVVFV